MGGRVRGEEGVSVQSVTAELFMMFKEQIKAHNH